MPEHLEDHDLGLAADLVTLVDRRMVLGLFAEVGLAALTGCGGDDTPAASASSSAPASATSAAAATTSATAAATGDCEEIPQETAGPYPGDGSNGPNVLTQSGIVRSDIRSSFGSASGTAAGVPTTVTLTITDAAKNCAALAGAAVYLWHCDRDGHYSMYSESVENQNYLRGVQQTDASGKVTFQTIFPACYSGRWPHMHFEVYPSLAAVTLSVPV